MARKSTKKVTESTTAAPITPLGLTARRQLVKGLTLTPKNQKQADFLTLLDMDGVDLVFGIGAAGTGKTLCALMYGLMNIESYDKIIYIRPNVSCKTEDSLGALPGSQEEKLYWIRLPIYDQLSGIMNESNINRIFDGGLIEISNVSQLRGRSLETAYIIVDEAQNLSADMLKTVLTRIGQGSKMVVVGDSRQSDLKKGVSALKDFSEKLSDLPEIGIVEFGREDIVRNILITKILDRIDPEV